MAAATLFIPTAAAESRRLGLHCKKLARKVINNRDRSPEIVLAFMINIPWMAPGKHWADDETCAYMASALTIATDISLNKLIVPSPSNSLAGVHQGREPSDYMYGSSFLFSISFYGTPKAISVPWLSEKASSECSGMRQRLC